MHEDHEHQDGILETVRVREVVGVVHNREELDALIDRLTRAGFDRSDIDLMASRDTVLRKLGTVFADPTLAADAPGTPRREVVRPQQPSRRSFEITSWGGRRRYSSRTN
jgi:hypothetical protein